MSSNADFRLRSHPILPIEDRPTVSFRFNGEPLQAFEGEVISSALFARGIRVFGHHASDDAPQGMFCANGQCSQCLVVADGVPVKGCMVPVREGMDIRSCEGIPELALSESLPEFTDIRTLNVPVLIVGGGPSGLTAAAELGALGIRTLLIDDKFELGGKLTLQTHSFFGSRGDCYAGTRGIDIATILADEVAGHESVEVWLGATAVGIYHDKKIGVMRGDEYTLVEPEVIIVAAGAREKGLAFPGCDLPGVYGAGAFQTLVNRDRIRASDKLFIVGGGNVGLIAAYHALQAGIEVVGLVEALPAVGGYKVHQDKIKRLGVPVWTSHTVVRAEGGETVERVTIAAVDEKFNPIPGTHRTFEIDTLLIAVGLSPVNELLIKARDYGIKAFAAGDSQEIAEASAAIFSGRIVGREVARELGHDVEIPDEWRTTAEVLRSKPGETLPVESVEPEGESFPIFRCSQEIPCNPCIEVCPLKHIEIPDGSIMGLPEYVGDDCIKCGKCVLVCPGLAVAIVIKDDPEKKKASIMLPWELPLGDLQEGSMVETVDDDGNEVGQGAIKKIKLGKYADRRYLITVEVPFEHRMKVAGFRPHPVAEPCAVDEGEAQDGDPVVCRCSRVRKSGIVGEIRAGVRDMNQLKASVRSGMGACGGNTCTELILRIFREEGVDPSEVTLPSERPLETEVPLSAFAGVKNRKKK
ncbi:MAG: (2Fe-2S)-binding protein [Phycisphaerales bacterium]|nr:MAG: (2Fe-2S)-binding protein [Phycisphaerales bacterium]